MITSLLEVVLLDVCWPIDLAPMALNASLSWKQDDPISTTFSFECLQVSSDCFAVFMIGSMKLVARKRAMDETSSYNAER
jgi:hypothetical protein